MEKKLIGILTGGGDCPGLNAVIRAIVRKGINSYNYEFIGIKNGWAGLLGKNTILLGEDSVSEILIKGGTIIGTSRTNPAKEPELMNKVINNFNELGLYALIVIGGDDTLGVASKLFDAGLNIIGVPKTIDNDLSGTDQTFGFDTAVSIATEAVDRLHSTAESHDRVMVVEVMGREAGWIATYAGIAGGADIILIPEEPFDINEICALLEKRRQRDCHFSIIVVAEGAMPKDKDTFFTKDDKVDDFGHVSLGGISEYVAKKIKEMMGWDTRTTILGHVQRGGTPTAYDRILATRYGVKAIDLVSEGNFGKMAALRCNRIDAVPLSEAVSKNKKVDKEIYEIAKIFFG
jgi:6-phosphofructokinase 1